MYMLIFFPLPRQSKIFPQLPFYFLPHNAYKKNLNYIFPHLSRIIDLITFPYNFTFFTPIF